MMTSTGYRVMGKVEAVTDTHVKMDFNHPLAGKDVRFNGRIIAVREATPEELSPAQGCGCGCGSCDDGCDCGDGGQCGCGDSECGCGGH